MKKYTVGRDVVNKYKPCGLEGYQFEWNGRIYTIEIASYKLIIKEASGEVFCSLDVDSYYDCGILIGDIFFWGERLGKISGYSMSDRKICFCSYINEDAATFYEAQASIYPSTFPPKTGDYAFLPEINIANLVVSKLCITVLTSFQHYLIVGDLSGYVSIFDVNTLQLIQSFTVYGSVVGIEMDSEKITIDSIHATRLSSPIELSQCREALRMFVEIDL